MRIRFAVLPLAASLTLLSACASSPSGHSSAEIGRTASNVAANAAALDAAIAGTWRDPKNVARDIYRHPRQTLAFFGVEPDDTVIEITPGSGWYSEILAPYLRTSGRYVAAVIDPMVQPAGRSRDYYAKARTDIETKFKAGSMHYGSPTVVGFDAKAPVLGAPGSADVVLTFRNVHNWRSAGNAEATFKGFYDVLKSGGTLGVVEHRAAGDVPADDKSGYVGQAQVIAMAQAAGFRLDGQSEINANPLDTKDHPNGVWMLPPASRHDAKDAAKYLAIGESDRMTLRFRKP